MSLETIISFVTLLGLGGVIGAYFNHLFEKRRELELQLRQRKEDQYKKFLENGIGFFEGWEGPKRKKGFMRELYTHAPLYASTNVIRLANNFISAHSGKKTPDGDSDYFYKKLVVAMRKDMDEKSIWQKLKFWENDNLSEKDINIFKLDE